MMLICDVTQECDMTKDIFTQTYITMVKMLAYLCLIPMKRNQIYLDKIIPNFVISPLYCFQHFKYPTVLYIA